MIPELEKYLLAVAMRKAIDHKAVKVVNYAIVAQLENNDIPRLLEIIRIQSQAIERCAVTGKEHDDAETQGHCAVATAEVLQLALAGSTQKWGRE